MPQLFHTLDDKASFCSLVKNHFQQAPKRIADVMVWKHNVSDERIEFAFNEYAQSLSKFAVYLNSQNPDHYKRAGALLHALNTSKIITSVEQECSAEDLESGFTRVIQADADHIAPLVGFYEVFYNQALAFDLAYACCSAYENNPRPYDLDYLHTVCRYLLNENKLSVDSCFLLFKSLML